VCVCVVCVCVVCVCVCVVCVSVCECVRQRRQTEYHINLYAPYKPEIMLRQNCNVLIPIVKIVLSNMTVTPNNASQVVIRLNISHPQSQFSVTFTSRQCLRHSSAM
jgi:hypothetical protein